VRIYEWLLDHSPSLRSTQPIGTPELSRLDFDAAFYLDGSVPAQDDMTSLTGIGPPAARQHAGAAFTTTHWSVVLEAQGESPAAQEALEKLCRTYWRPVYSFIRRQSAGPQEAEDLTQGFFVLLLERRDFDSVRKEKGRLRSYLLSSLKHFLVSEHRRAVTAKRGKGQQLIPLEELSARERLDMGRADSLSADRLYERRWALTLMEEVLRRLKDEYYTAGNGDLFESLKRLLPDEPEAASRAEIAAHLA
jgi:RNA polymerase sigma-70 factor (ECF subfamily)